MASRQAMVVSRIERSVVSSIKRVLVALQCFTRSCEFTRLCFRFSYSALVLVVPSLIVSSIIALFLSVVAVFGQQSININAELHHRPNERHNMLGLLESAIPRAPNNHLQLPQLRKSHELQICHQRLQPQHRPVEARVVDDLAHFQHLLPQDSQHARQRLQLLATVLAVQGSKARRHRLHDVVRGHFLDGDGSCSGFVGAEDGGVVVTLRDGDVLCPGVCLLGEEGADLGQEGEGFGVGEAGDLGESGFGLPQLVWVEGEDAV